LNDPENPSPTSEPKRVFNASEKPINEEWVFHYFNSSLDFLLLQPFGHGVLQANPLYNTTVEYPNSFQQNRNSPFYSFQISPTLS